MDGNVLWQAGQGGNQPSRPMSVAVHDMTGDGAADVVCFWHVPERNRKADWQSLADVVVQIRDGRTSEVIRQSAPTEITSRRRRDPTGSNWIHQRILIANFRGTQEPRDLIVKLGDTYVALDEHLDVLWTYRSQWAEYSRCPAYIPAVGDIDDDGRDEVNGGYFVIDHDGEVMWSEQLGRHMDSVEIAEWDNGQKRAICSGFGHVVDAQGRSILSLGKAKVPHGQEVRVADFNRNHPGPEMVLRHKGHTPDVLIVSSENGQVIDRLRLNSSPTNVGMEAVYCLGRDEPALLYNGGWLWDLTRKTGCRLPSLPPPNGGKVHRMGFYHAIAADICSDAREELVAWDPTATHIYIFSPDPIIDAAYSGYKAGPRQYNPRLMD
jgi:hypothetical protein